MRDLLIYLVKSIVDNTNDVDIIESSQAGTVILEIVVNPTDMGKVIGRGGRIIKALRDLVRVLAVKQNLRVNVTLREG